jgi:hypothetical protein
VTAFRSHRSRAHCSTWRARSLGCGCPCASCAGPWRRRR